ncbi:uncharacterized protein LOC141842922 [Curcuma longa]|uniref:uncharacterized protein LOC141842922 n=1 Tax=Curcuma longa TaxID=136217 RepID=UPI003D9E388D
MVVKTMMRLSPPSPENMRMRKKFKVCVRVDAVEGLPSALPGSGAAAAVEIEWRRRPSPMVVGALSFLVGRKKPERGVTSKRIVEEEGLNVAAARWGDGDQENRFEKVCRFRDSDLVAGPIDGLDSCRAWEVSFTVLYGNSDDGVEVKELERIGTATVDLVEWARESLSQKTGGRAEKKELKKRLPISLGTDSLSSYGMLYVTVSFTEVSTGNVKPSSSANVENTQKEQMGRQIERSNSGSSDRGNTEDDDILSGNGNRSHTASSSGISSPEPESTSKRWFSWRKKSKSSFSYRDLDGESKRTSLSQELFFSDNINKGSSGGSSQDDIDPIGRWTSEEFVSRDKQAKLKVQTFFASIDQRDPTAGGESACTAIVAVIADALHRSDLNTPTRSEFDALIREGSLEWQKLCNNKSYIERFPDKHFDLETILEAKTRPISILHDKSFIGFFQPESFKSLHGLMSFDDVWAEIVSDDARDGKVYIISWNDHFFILKLEADAYYIMDTLGERLHEGCQKAYVLRFDDTTEMYLCCEENKGAEDNEELICRGKDCCREYINRFLAAIPLQEELELEKKGIETNTSLHQRLQIEFHLTQASTDGGSDGHLNCNDCWTSTVMNPWTTQGETILLGI